MDMNKYYINENEKPLDNIVNDGGFCGIFRRIGCVGDSLSSGEFQVSDGNGGFKYYDFYEYSWGQYIARATGSEVFNFSRGGMTAKEYCEDFAEHNRFWSEKYAAQAYIIALGVNDIINQNMEYGSIEDINIDDCMKNKATFCGYYAQIVQRLKKISPNAKFFFMTMPKESSDCEIGVDRKEKHKKLLYELAEFFDNAYVLDLYTYAPVYDEKFKETFFLSAHMSPTGYLLTAKMVMSYIDYIIRLNPDDFKYAGFIGTGIEL